MRPSRAGPRDHSKGGGPVVHPTMRRESKEEYQGLELNGAVTMNGDTHVFPRPARHFRIHEKTLEKKNQFFLFFLCIE